MLVAGVGIFMGEHCTSSKRMPMQNGSLGAPPALKTFSQDERRQHPAGRQGPVPQHLIWARNPLHWKHSAHPPTHALPFVLRRTSAGSALRGIKGATSWLQLPHMAQLDEPGLAVGVRHVIAHIQALLAEGPAPGPVAAAGPAPAPRPEAAPAANTGKAAGAAAGPRANGHGSSGCVGEARALLQQLAALPVTARMLSDTGAGKAVNALKKHVDRGVAAAAAAVVTAWKERVLQKQRPPPASG